MNRMMRDADPNPMTMWRWHIMEEFEHRTVCHDACALLDGRYWQRVYAFVYQFVSLERMVDRVYRYLLKVDRATMSAEQVKRSKKSARLSMLGFFTPILKGMKTILRPGYSPHDIPEPPGWANTRADIEMNWMVPGQSGPAAS